MAVCCARAGAVGPRGVTGSPCRVSGRTTNCRPKEGPNAAVRAPGARGRALPARAASTPCASSATGPADRSRSTCSPTRASPRNRRCATFAPSPRRCSASSSTTASCRSPSSNTNDQNTPVGIELPRAESRARIGSINVEAVGLRAQVRVVLIENDREHTGYAEGSIASAARPQLVAAAALDAVRQAEPAAEAIHITSAEISRIGSNRVAVVTVVYVDPPTELVVSGSAVVRRDRDDAVAARAARRHEPSARPRRTRSRVGLIRRRGRIRASLGPVPPVAVQLSYRLGGADGVAVEARKWEWALHELGFDVRRVAGELDDGLRPDDAWLPFLAIDPVDDERTGTGRARGRHRRGRSRHRREPVLAPDQPRRVGDDRGGPRRARRPRRVPSPRPPVATRRSADTTEHPAAPATTRCTSRSTTIRACSSRTAASTR